MSKCPDCGCTETTITQWFSDDGVHVDETLIRCKSCKKKEFHWGYGVTFVKDWEEREEGFTDDIDDYLF